jgi:anti-sigma B factor antagonist
MRPPTISEEAGVLVITFDDQASMNDGRSDAYRQSLYDLLQSVPEPRVAADLAPIDYLSSSGVALLVGLKRRLDARQGKLVLFHLHPYVLDVLRVMKLDRLLAIAESREAALAQLAPPPA